MKDEITFAMFTEFEGFEPGQMDFWYAAFKAYGEFGPDVARMVVRQEGRNRA